jgi:superfamily I DNA/RNA helicase
MNNLNFCSEDTISIKIEEVGFIKFKSIIFNFIHLLPNTNVTLGEWVDETNKRLKFKNLQFNLDIANAGRDYSFQQVFLKESENISDRNYRLGTVHSVKGETFDATLLILKTKGVGKAYRTILSENIPISDSEELRIVYVGMTRPRKILVIAVPDEANKTTWENKLNRK